MLATVLGPGNAVVRVSVDVDTSSSTTTEETFNPDGQVLRNSTVTDDTTVSSESGSGIGGAVGEVANTPSETGAAALGSASPLTSSQQKRTTKTESYEIARSTTRTERTAGEIRRIAAAVFVAARTTGTGEARQVQPRDAEEVESIRRMVVTALGVVPPRGQTLDQVVTVQEVDFAPDPVEEELGVLSQEFEWRPWFEVGRNVLFALLALGGFVYFVRLVRRSQAEAVSFEVFNSGENGHAGELQGEVTPDLLNEMIRQRPDNVSITLKRWMSADQK
jgi:flagellar M-ring protein FliF